MKSLSICVIFAIFVSHAKSELQLKMLHVLFRHGDKVPDKLFQNYPNDPHGNHSFLPIDSGGLTTLGMMREFKIGLMLREKYDDYFGSQYWPSLVYGRSTDVPRTKMSLQLVLSGLFPPTRKQEWNRNLPWIPVDFEFVPFEKDSLLFPSYCPEYKETYKKFLNQPEVKNFLSTYKEVFDYLTEKTGKTVQTTSTVYYLYNLLKEEAAQNLSLPIWTQSVYPIPMKNITAMDFNLRSNTTKLKRLNGGMLLRKITDDIKEVRAGTMKPPDRKAFFFSAHELNVVSFARVLGLNTPILPSYGSTFIIETLQNESNDYFIRIFLWTGVTEMYLSQTIPGCREICPLDEFLKLLNDVIPSDKEYNCYQNSASALIENKNLFSLVLIAFTYLFSSSLR
ncbi:venom acid phosphatase Acph-1-like [Leptopilina heterotoma]|uniref:venom acid phosphatase Acph-1-like n=1 Tax=Leptopilina heterotoma TaxID=63436 RepID=UPI001CA846E2|nr:venom acid phosphatase Acph-1-like [Leptopilina heterotoma]